jgi:tripartite-type tricarboxylate transporter receptor subunit TctC
MKAWRFQVSVDGSWWHALGLAAAVMMAPVAAHADVSYPSRAVKLVVTYSAGGAFDYIGRLLAKGLQDLWDQPVVIENRPGGSGVIGAVQVARAAPDGLTLLIGSAGPIVVVPFLRDNLPYDPRVDFTPIAVTAIMPNVLVVNAKSPYKTFDDLIADAKARPGMIDYASSGKGDSHHMTMEHLMRATGVKFNEIPYKGGAPAALAVASGEVQVAWLAPSTALPLIPGQVRPLAVSTLERISSFPDIPTVAERGYPGFEVIYWIGVMGPANMPPAIVAKLQADLRKVVSTGSYKESILKTGNELRFNTSDEYAAIIRTDYERNKRTLAP